MRLENSFDVPATPGEAWELLTDVPRVIPCMPGAELVEAIDDRHWKARMHVKLGPIALDFATDIEQAELEEHERRAVLAARAREARGRGGAQATIESSLVAAGAGTRVTIVTDLSLQGAVAQYGRGVVADVAAQLVRRFADCIAAELSEQQPPGGDGRAAAAEPAASGSSPAPVQPVGGLGLVLRALWQRVTRLFRRSSMSL